MSNLPPPPPPQYGPLRPPPSSGKVRLRGRIPLRLALILGIVGVVLISIGAVVLANGSIGKIDDFERVGLSNSAQTVRFDRAGKYVGYFETPSDGSHRADVRLAIADAADKPVTVRLYNASELIYSQGGRHGEALFTFSIPKSGEYQVLARSDDAPAGAGVAFGESIAGSLVAGVLLVLPGVLLVIAAIVLLIVGLVKHGRHKRERQAYFDAYRGP